MEKEEWNGKIEVLTRDKRNRGQEKRNRKKEEKITERWIDKNIKRKREIERERKREREFGLVGWFLNVLVNY